VVKLKPLKNAPVLVAIGILVLICIVRLLKLDFFERLEAMTYDMRAREAIRFPEAVATNLAFVSMEDSSIAAVNSGRVDGVDLGYHSGLYWQRQVYGRLVEELSAQGAKAVAFDILFDELRTDHPPVQMSDGSFLDSDEYFALQMRRAHNVILADTASATLPDLFATNALTVGGISTEKDSDGILRRVKAFDICRRWHPLFKKVEADPDFGVDLSKAQFIPGAIVLPQTGTTNVIRVPVDAGTNFALADFIGDKLPPGVAPRARAFTDERIWQIGIVLAARELKLDLVHADVDLAHGRITLRGTNGVERVIPVDARGYFYIDWRMTQNDPNLVRAPIESLLLQDHQRLLGETNGLGDAFRGKLIMVGSAAQGNDLTDRGATPLEKDTLLVGAHWNVANSVITGHFIRRVSLGTELALIVFLGALSALATWQLRAGFASTAVFLLALIYIAIAFYVFARYGCWLPLVLPIAGAMLMEHVSLVTYRVVFEEREKRRVRSIFSKIVSPEVVNELLQSKKLSLGGTRREVTVLFTDVRDFTALTDEMQERAAEFVRVNHLDPDAAAAHFDVAAREILDAVNLYLVLVADAVKKHSGTLDKYIGDCVMAFWGAPVANKKHALACVRAAIDSQRAIYELNQKRAVENAKREVENRSRAIAKLPPKPMLPAQQLGAGINTGTTTVGLVGSDEHQYNYTVFGREVNLAARLESVSGSGRIIISEATFQHLLRDDQILAATCMPLEPVTVKGIRAAVKIYEVPWQQNK
jgi:class 3 adenylate cyclase